MIDIEKEAEKIASDINGYFVGRGLLIMGADVQRGVAETIAVSLDLLRVRVATEHLSLAAKIVHKLEIAMTPDFATQIEQALNDAAAIRASKEEEGLNG